MPKFSQESFSQLSTCHHDLQVLFYEVVKHIECDVRHGSENSVYVATPTLDLNVEHPYYYYFAGYVMGVAQLLKETGKMTHSVRFCGEYDTRDLNHFELII